MLGLKSMIKVIDNTGASLVELINVYKVKHKRKKSVGVGRVGDEVKVVIHKSRVLQSASLSTSTKLRKGDMARGVITSCRKQETRADGRVVQFDESTCVLLNAKGEMMGSRIAGPVSAALRDVPSLGVPGGRWSKILALAPKVL